MICRAELADAGNEIAKAGLKRKPCSCPGCEADREYVHEERLAIQDTSLVYVPTLSLRQ